MNNIVGDCISISTKCEDPDLLIKALDWCFTEPGINLCNYGIEGVSYDLDENGNAVWSLGLQDCIDAQQGAYDRYVSRGK